ncbi:hypothetical protein BGL52_00170 [Lacticaseibacillus casei]|uniref:Uncharacterized protein n=1 Tax=Lacticaseibacillus casei TaxID=1582 RepID=A0AAN1EXH4_LACCA|nr:hypothetical protein BGL52_00170 [Lacticaseibacillus casei]
MNFKRRNKFVFTKIFHAVPNYAISGQMGLERGGHDFEPAKYAVSKLGLIVGGKPPTMISQLSPIWPTIAPPWHWILTILTNHSLENKKRTIHSPLFNNFEL